MAREDAPSTQCGRHVCGFKSSADQIKNSRDTIDECSVMDNSMSISGTVAPTGVTSFANEACEATYVLGDYIPNTLAEKQPDLQDVTEYFARPRLAGRGQFLFGTGSPLAVFGFGADNAILKSIFPQWTQRLAGAYGIRFTMNFRLQVSATAFHQGVGALCFQYGKVGASTEVFNRASFRGSATNLPHVRLDLSEHTMVELKVPFLATTEYWVIEQIGPDPYPNDYGVVTFIPILPSVSTPGLAPATYALYVYLTDIELYGADVINASTINLQSGAGLITKEVKESSLISGTLSNMARISSFVARGVPSLSAIAGPATWALDIASGVAKYFGYARPMVQDPPHKILRSNFASEVHVDTPMVGEVVGLFQGNTLTIDTNLAASNVDEMALKHVTSQWSQVALGFISTDNVHGQAVYAAPVSPCVFWYRASSTAFVCNIRFPGNSGFLASQSGNCIMPSSLMNISSYFRLWRGSIKFRFTFAKTKLHGGRYMVTFNPYQSYTPTINNFGGAVNGPEIVSGLMQPYGNSMIIDLKDGNVFEFTAPYVSKALHCPFESAIGGLSLICMETLQATSTVTGSVPFLVEVCGGDDYELSDFAGNYFVPSSDGTIYTQSGDLVKTTTKDPLAHTMGEQIMSVKQMIQAPTTYRFDVAAGAVNKYWICPWFVNPTYSTISSIRALPNGIVPTASLEGLSASGTLSKCYYLCKGGTDIHVYPMQTGTFSTVIQNATTVLTEQPVNGPKDYARRPFLVNVPKIMNGIGNAIHARLPSFQMTARVPTFQYDAVFSGSRTVTGNTPLPYLSHLYRLIVDARVNGSTDRMTVSVAAADDAALGHYYGPVPIFIPNILQNEPANSALDSTYQHYN